MQITITKDPIELGRKAGSEAAVLIRDTIRRKGTANIVLATGTSQIQTLQQLVSEPGIDWSKVVMFHLDEYIGLPITSGASFRKYLQDRFITKVPSLKAAYLIDGENDPQQECIRLADLIAVHPTDVALVGIGENGHLAFNDPPADFETEESYIVVELDEPCRRQQLGEGWFASIEDVPRQAISMSVKQIMKANHIICSVPDRRKAEAVRNTIEHPVSNLYPASILKTHPDCRLFLDDESAELLSKKPML